MLVCDILSVVRACVCAPSFGALACKISVRLRARFRYACPLNVGVPVHLASVHLRASHVIHHHKLLDLHITGFGVMCMCVLVYG